MHVSSLRNQIDIMESSTKVKNTGGGKKFGWLGNQLNDKTLELSDV